ncbi:MAG: hypothetical protein LBG27_12530 [Spirochaetaceae bacterium]|nr:hypothetical protein [Spirochaetaceae bacterium]
MLIWQPIGFTSGLEGGLAVKGAAAGKDLLRLQYRCAEAGIQAPPLLAPRHAA